MSDSAIKLFGKTIPLPLYHHRDFSSSSSSSSSSSTSTSSTAAAANHSCFVPVVDDFPDNNSPSSLENKSGKEQEPQELNREPSGKEITDDKKEDSTTSNQATEDSKDPTTTSSGITEKPDRETSPPLKISSKNGEQSETSISQEKTLKKPDKILPCPRCNSMDTKFCYYNNYNVNQPRHFCKNCQRYWTAGGTMRNVPIGAGRRKNKSSSSSSSSHYRHIMVSEALRTAQIQNPSLGNNTTVLNFGSDSPLCESVATVLNLSEKTTNNFRNGYHRPQADNGDDRLSGSSVTASNSSEKVSNCGLQELVTKNYQGFGSQIPCFPGPPWPYPMAAPAFCPSGFPVSFYPAPPYWGCTVPSPWNLQAQCISPASPLGKHSREGNIISSAANSEDPLSRESNCTETNILVPKTLRIDDPSEAAKSSIWATLGIESKKSNFNGGGLFKGFQSKTEDRNYIADKSSVLQANPAAFSRSLNFHERT